MQFYEMNKHHFNKDLKKQLHSFVTETNKQSMLSRWLTAGKFFDLEDLKTRYEKKPDQLKNLLENAPTFYHPHRCVQMWQDAEFENAGEETNERTLEVKTEASQVQQISKDKASGGAKRKRGDNTNVEGGGEPPVTPPLKAGVLKKINSLVEKLGAVKVELEVLREECKVDTIKDEIMPKTINRTDAILAKLEVQENELALVIESRTNVDTSTTRATECLEEATKFRKALKQQVDAAAALAE